jgi:hypothetical protein
MGQTHSASSTRSEQRPRSDQDDAAVLAIIASYVDAYDHAGEEQEGTEQADSRPPLPALSALSAVGIEQMPTEEHPERRRGSVTSQSSDTSAGSFGLYFPDRHTTEAPKNATPVKEEFELATGTTVAGAEQGGCLTPTTAFNHSRPPSPASLLFPPYRQSEYASTENLVAGPSTACQTSIDATGSTTAATANRSTLPSGKPGRSCGISSKHCQMS